MSVFTDTEEFPFKSRLDFRKLIEFWNSQILPKSFYKKEAFKEINKKLKSPELLKIAGDPDFIHRERDMVDYLMSAVVPVGVTEKVVVAAYEPFQPFPFFSTTGFNTIFPQERPSNLHYGFSNDKIENSCAVMAGIYILKQFYRSDLSFDYPMLVDITNTDTGLESVYKFDIDTQFADVEVIGELPEISEETIDNLLKDLNNADEWLLHLPPEKFVFRGFTLVHFTDVTAQEMQSSIKFYLLKRDAVTCGTNFLSIQQKIRSIYRMPDLSLGIVFFDRLHNIISNGGMSDWNSLMINKNTTSVDCDFFIGSIYDTVYSEERTVVIPDLTKLESLTHIENALITRGFRNMAIAPLIKDDNVIGMLELGSKEPGKINSLNVNNLRQILPMFTAAVDRVLGDLKLEVRATIQKECTAIHPSVEWKFMEAGYDVVRAKHAGKKIKMPEIRFENVYPLYGMSDVRSSSEIRNQTVRADLMKNLFEASQVLNTMHNYKAMPVLDEIRYKVDKEHKRLEKGLVAGDESGVMDFLTKEVNPALKLFARYDNNLNPIVEEYLNMMDENHGIIYEKRKDFEQSLTMINETISNYIDQAEAKAQEILPHYFEKYKTDGVEYNMYLGNSLMKEPLFDPIYLRNFRLWQLIMMSEIAINVRKIQPSLPDKLDITQLILVHSDPLAIHFRKDEKRFDVDGAYNIRYEIIKKRIDKALIKDSKERITQPEKIAIIYNRDKEAKEYIEYIQYLKSLGYLKGEVENFELQELQGAKGLKALRIQIDTEADINSSDHQDLLKEITEFASVN